MKSPSEFEVRFTHAPLRTELLFRFPVISNDVSGVEHILSRRFQQVNGTDREAVYRRVISEPDGLAEYHVAEIVEHRFDSPERAVQGLLRGEISLLPDLPIWALSLVRDDPRFFVLNYALPTTHVLQINPRRRRSEAASCGWRWLTRSTHRASSRGSRSTTRHSNTGGL